MKITGKIRGDLIGVALKYDEKSGIRLATAKIAASGDREQIADHFGARLAEVAFASMRVTHPGGEAEPGVSFGYSQLKPDLVCEYHEIEIVGKTIDCQPVIKTIAPVKGEESVVVTLEIPINIAKSKTLAGALAVAFGEVIDIECTPKQKDLFPAGTENRGPEIVVTKGAFGNPKPVAAAAPA